MNTRNLNSVLNKPFIDKRKVPPGTVRKIVLVKDLNERHHEIARLVVLGYKNNEIATMLHLNYAFVSSVRNAPQVKEQISFMRAARDKDTVDIAKQIKEALPECIRYLSETIPDPEVSDHIRSKNAFGLLAIGGHTATKNVNIKGVHAVLTADDIKEIRDNATKIAGEIDILAESTEDTNG